MAYVKVLGRSGPGDQLRVCFFVSSGVGRGQANLRDDTLLVQFFLNKLWTKTVKSDTYGVPGKPPLAIDGQCGANTLEAIKRFQGVYYSTADVKIQDGIVDPQPDGQPTGPRHGQTYTIAALNYAFSEEFGAEKHMMIINEPGFPGDLRLKFYA
jgi:hypothetical protein